VLFYFKFKEIILKYIILDYSKLFIVIIFYHILTYSTLGYFRLFNPNLK